MGLAIYAYSGLSRVPFIPDTWEDDGTDNMVRIYANEDFPGREAPMVDRGVYTYERVERALSRSYSGYSAWREKLAELAGYPAVEVTRYLTPERRHDEGCRVAGSGPFYELIWFSDCYGTLGTDACQKLLADFDANPMAAATAPQLVAGLRIAADNGCLVFR